MEVIDPNGPNLKAFSANSAFLESESFHTEAILNLKRDYPPHYLFLGLLLQYGLRKLFPAAVLPDGISRPAGIGLVTFGIATVLLIALQFRRNRTTIRPFETPAHLIAAGPYRMTRNPIYLAMGVVLIGWGLWLGSLPALLVPPLFAVVVTQRFIRPEERDLAAAFGAEYEAYRRRVPRWL